MKIENVQWNRVTNRSATCCNLHELCFSACNYTFANKVDILQKEQKTVDFEASDRISKINSFSRYLENAKARNVLMQRYLYGIT